MATQQKAKGGKKLRRCLRTARRNRRRDITARNVARRRNRWDASVKAQLADMEDRLHGGHLTVGEQASLERRITNLTIHHAACVARRTRWVA